MIQHGESPYLECSSKGDKRFSAFHARLRKYSNRCIEEIFQSSKKFDKSIMDENGFIDIEDWKNRKGRKAINQEEVAKLYSELWDDYISENPELKVPLICASGLSDIFGQSGHCCQATELWRIRQNLICQATELQAIKSGIYSTREHISVINKMKDYDLRVIVAGSRGYDDYEFFSKIIDDFVDQHKDKKIIFLSGMAKSGADALIVKYCIEHNMEWVEFPAEWDNFDLPGAVIKTNSFNKKYVANAGHIRNKQMANHATHLVAFWNGRSPGTANMIDIAKDLKLFVTTVLIDQDHKNNL